MSRKDKNTADLFTPRDRRKSQGVLSLKMHVLLQTAPNTQHHENTHLSGVHQDSEAPERMLLAVESERTSTGDDVPRPWAQLLVLTVF